MKKTFPRIGALLLALLMLLGVSSLATQDATPIEALAAQLQQAQAAFTQASEDLIAADAQVADLEDQYARDEDDAALQDALIDAMILQEEAADAFGLANDELAGLQTRQTELIQDSDCEDLLVEYDGKYADLLITATVDENLVLYALTVEVEGSERDQLVAENDYLYQFLGKDLPLTIGEEEEDDVAPLPEAQQTSRDLVDALNSLVWTGDEEAAGPIIEPQAIADYIFQYGKLPDNFITKSQAQALGWDSSVNDVSDVAPGKSIGGDRFGNYEGLLPDKQGRTWYEADCYYTSGNRNACRILYSSDGLVYYTDDHYESFTQMFPSK